MKKLTKNQWTNIVLAIVGLIVLWLVYKVVIKGQSINEIFGGKPKDDPIAHSPVPGSSTGTNTPPSYTNNTVFSVKSPLMKDDRVQWIQYRYNKLARLRKEKGKTPEWSIISEDGIFGNQTKSAVEKVMGKGSTSWNEFQAKATDLETQLSYNFSPGTGGSW